MDVIMVGPWMLSSQDGLENGRHHGWAMDALFSERFKPWTFHHGWAMDALLSGRIREWTSSWLGHGCPLLRTV